MKDMSKEETDEEDSDFKEFIKKFKKDVVRLQNVSPLMNNDKIREKIGIFYNAYYSHQLAKFTKYLAYATIVLAASTILQTINFIYGQDVARNFIVDATRFALVGTIFIIGIKFAIDIVTDAYHWLRNKVK